MPFYFFYRSLTVNDQFIGVSCCVVHRNLCTDDLERRTRAQNILVDIGTWTPVAQKKKNSLLV